MKQFICIFLLLIVISCGDDKKDSSKTKQVKSELSVVRKHLPIKPIKADFKKEVEDWQELLNLSEQIKKLEKISPNEALGSAFEINFMTASLKDNDKPEILDTPAFHSRLNVLYNETLRFKDITLIPAITAKEVNTQVAKVITAFSAVNSKINTVFSKKRFEDALDVKIDFIGIDSTKMDSVTLKTINIKKQEELLQNKKK